MRRVQGRTEPPRVACGEAPYHGAMSSGSGGAPLTLMGVHGQPDDEGHSTGGVLAGYAAEGVANVLVTCTTGELGDGPGGAEPGETLADAARREVYEEAGHILGDVGPVVWERTNAFEFDGRSYVQEESYFVVRTAHFEARRVAFPDHRPERHLQYDPDAEWSGPSVSTLSELLPLFGR